MWRDPKTLFVNTVQRFMLNKVSLYFYMNTEGQNNLNLFTYESNCISYAPYSAGIRVEVSPVPSYTLPV